MSDQQQIFAEQIEEIIKKPVRTKEEMQSLIIPVATGVLFLTRGQEVIAKELYGNGVPGGLKAKIQGYEEIQLSIKSDILEIKKKLNVEKKSTFDRMVDWTVDKVLPAIVITAILAFFNGIFIVAVAIWAWQNGYGIFVR